MAILRKELQSRLNLNQESIQQYFVSSEIAHFNYLYSQDKVTCLKQWNHKVYKLYLGMYFSHDFTLFQNLHHNGYIQSYFDFLGPTYNEWLREGRSDFLRLPIFKSRNEQFNDIYEANFKNLITFKVFCQILKKFGVNGLNNLLIFKDFSPLLPAQSYLSLPLHKPLYKIKSVQSYARPRDMQILSRRYAPIRTYNILTGFTAKTFSNFLYQLDRSAGVYKNDRIWEFFPKKPKSLDDLLRKTDLKLLKYVKSTTDFPLHVHPRLAELNKTCFHEYEISFPLYKSDLHEISNILRNCVHSYDERINAKKSVVLTLDKSGTPYFCLELDYSTLEPIQVKKAYNQKINNDEKFITNNLLKHLQDYRSL